MLVTEEKTLIHFDTNEINVYSLKENALELLSTELVTFEESYVNELLLQKIDGFFGNFAKYAKVVDNEHTRLYATGVFQGFSQPDQTKLVIHIYVNYGLYLNVIQPDLERFYLEKSRVKGDIKTIMGGLINQEFRKVVVCGSFQHHLKDFDEVIGVLHNRNITVLSPWTTKIQPQTLGTDFVLLEGQAPLKNKRDSWSHKYEHMDKFRQSDAIIVCNPDGLVGKGTMFELGFIVAISKRIIFTEKPTNLSVSFPYEVGLIF